YPAGRHDLIEPLLGYLADCIPAHLRPVAASRPNRALDIPFFLPQNDTPTFTGRGEELRRLESLLLNRKGKKLCSIVGLAGTGGVGKSALACHFAERYKNEFPGGVIGLRVDDKDLDTIVRDFARCIKEEIDPDDQRDASTLMQEMFRNRRALLIFDNAENPEIRSLHPGGDLCAVILTTRDRMLPLLIDIPAEGRIDLSVLPKSKAFKLLRRLIGDKRIAAEVKASIEVTGHVGCLPLALQIAGAALQMQAWPSIAEYADALREERLEVLRVRGNEHLDVRASFSLSLKFLEAEELDFFACLSVCAQDGFSLKAAVAATGHDKASAQQRLAYLYRLSLLNQAITGTGRYVFHPLIGSFAREIADERGLRDSAAERHAGFYTELIRSSDINDPEAASIIAAELDDILLAEQWRQQHELANDEILIRLQPFFQRAGHWQKAVKLISGSMSTAERKEDWRLLAQLYIQQAKYLSLQGDLGSAEETLAPVDEMLGKIEAQQVRRRCEAMLLNTRGGIFQRRGRFDDAVKAFEQSAVIEEELGNDHGQATVLNSLGGVLQRQGQFDKAVEAFQRSYDSLIQTGDERGQAMVLTSLGGVEQRMGQFENAANHFRSAIEIEERQGNSRGLAIVLNSLGGVLQRQGKLDEAEAAFRRSSVLEDQLGDKRGQAMVLNSLGGVLQRQGKLDKAEAAFRRSSEIGEALGDNRHLAMVLNSLGGVLKRQGRFDEAAEAFEQSYELLVELNDQRGQAMVLNSLGGVLQRQGKFDEAVDAFQRSLVISEEQNDQQSIAMRLNSLGGVLQRQGRFDEAEAAFRQSYAISELLGDQRSLAMVLNSLGDVLQRQGRFDEALEALNRSCSIFEKSKDLRSQAMVKFTLGKTFLSKGDVDKAVSALIKSFEINEKLRDKQGLAIVLLILVPVLRRLGRHKDASGILDRALKIDPQSNRLKNLKR
ncbi:MAG TPA: tetratricopeptide repeat protein, partial [Blastocatellia bacterium]|nr:tetratricopeptide repeat protein [Blastocatellia bacterium]